MIHALNHERDKSSNTNVRQKNCPIINVLTIAERLKHARESLGLKQEELAKLADVSQGTISNIENGIRKEPRKLLSIARALKVEAEWLSSGKGPAPQSVGIGNHVAEPVTNWAAAAREIQQALNVLEAAITRLDMRGRERIAPIFESFARGPGPVNKADIATLLTEGPDNIKSFAVGQTTGLQKTG